MLLEGLFVQIALFFIETIPNILYACLAVLVGLVIGNFLGKMTKGVLLKVKADRLFDDDNIKIKLSSVGELVVSWLIYLIFFQQAAVYLNVYVVSSIVNSLVMFIPNVIGAITVILLAYMFGIYLKDKVIGTKDVSMKLIGDAVFYLVIYIGVSTALPLIGINTALISQLLLLVVAGFSLGIAIALGLGLKDTIAKISARYFNVDSISKTMKEKSAKK